MDTKFQTSFIPKAPIMQAKTTKSSISFFLLISIIIFLVSLGLAAWVYLEKNYLIQQITSEQKTITTNKSGLVSDSNTVESIIDLNNRINIGKDLLSHHVAISPIFAFLQQVTLKNVRFNSFTFSSASKDSNGNTIVGIQLAGVAQDWESVASQADEFDMPAWKNIINDPKISNFGLNQDGSVSFSFSATINPQFLSYTNNIQNNQSGNTGGATMQPGQ